MLKKGKIEECSSLCGTAKGGEFLLWYSSWFVNGNDVFIVSNQAFLVEEKKTNEPFFPTNEPGPRLTLSASMSSV